MSLDAPTLEALVDTALERMAFLVVEPLDGPPDGPQADGPGKARHCRIAYSGPEAGELHLSATDGFVAELAGNLLGIEPDELNPAVEGQQALNELANALAGQVIVELGGRERPIRLGLPECCAAAPPAPAQLVPTRVAVESDGEWLAVQLWAGTCA